MDNINLREKLREASASPENPCFGCSPHNPHGLRLRIEQDGEWARAQFVPTFHHQGWPGVIHGGILAAALDEVMSWAVLSHDLTAVTARMEIRYRTAVRQGDDLCVRARIVRRTRRTVDLEGQIVRADVVVAEAQARFIKVGSLSSDELPGRGNGDDGDA